MKFSSLFSKFIDHGQKPSSAQEQSAILDEARSVVLDIARRAGTGELKVATLDERVAANSQKLASNKRPIYNRAAQPSAPASKPAASTAPTAAAKPLPAPAPSPKPAQTTTRPIPSPAKPGQKIITASEFTPPAVKMQRSEFMKLSDSERSRFIREGGRLI